MDGFLPACWDKGILEYILAHSWFAHLIAYMINLVNS